MLKECITPLFAQTKQMSELFAAEQAEMKQVEDAMISWLQELLIMTSDNTIVRWEDDYCLNHNTELTIEQRRARILAKRLQKKVPTKEKLQENIRSLLGAEKVEITEASCMFIVRVRTAVLSSNLGIAEDYFRDIRVAHFGYEFINQIDRTYSTTKYFSPVAFEHKLFKMEVQR